MKRLLLATALLSSLSAYAVPDVKEVYAQIDETTQIILSNQPCLKWKEPSIQLNFAYAKNVKTGEQVTGCFTHEGDVIVIELSDDANNMYHYRLKADHFMPKPSL